MNRRGDLRCGGDSEARGVRPVELHCRRAREVAAGNPVVVLQDVGDFFTQWHYAALVGFDYDRGDLYLRSGTEQRLVVPFTYFERTWIKSGYWAMVVTAPFSVR